MKKLFLILTSLMFLFISCQTEENKVKEFSEIYFDILMIREKEQDTALANPKVRELLKSYGHTDESFRNYSMELFSKNPQAFTAVIDSVKTKAEKKLIEYGNKNMKELDSANKKNAGESLQNVK